MLRREWGTVSGVYGDRTEKDRNATRGGSQTNGSEVALKVSVYLLQIRGVVPYLSVQEHFHSTPRWWHVLRESRSGRSAHELPNSGFFEPQTGPNRRQLPCQRRKDRSRAEWPYHLVVAQIDDEQIGSQLGTVLGDLAHHVRVDRRDAGVQDSELCLRVEVPKLNFQNPAKTERVVGNALGGGRSQEDNPELVFVLIDGKGELRGCAVQGRWKEAEAKISVGNMTRYPRNIGLLREGRVVSEMKDA